MGECYEPKSILITGAAGFIASHVANRLARKYPGYKVVVLDKLDYCSNLENLALSSSQLKFVRGDIASADLVNHLLVTECIDTVMHFAAQTHVDNSFGNSLEFTKNNIYGTHVLLEACRVFGGIRRFVHVSTDEVYGETDADAVIGNRESSSQLLPTNPYAATKAGAEMLVMAYGHSYNLPFITTRGNNVYGPNQFPEKLIPKFILLAMHGRHLPIHGDGSNIRSYLFVDDVADAFETILHRGRTGQVYNIGTLKERCVLDVAKDICRLFDRNPDEVIEFVDNRPFNDQRYFLDDMKLKALGWSERTSWEDGLRKTMEWYISHPDWWGDVSGALVPHPCMVTPHHYHDDSTPSITANGSKIDSVCRTELKFLIYGQTGWIGGLLGNLCKERGITFVYGSGQLENRAQIEADIVGFKPTHVFNASGVIEHPNVDWCESHKTETIRADVTGTLTLADACLQHCLLLVNFATGCISEYDDTDPLGSRKGFCEDDKPNFTGSFYSKTKAMVEELLKEYPNVCTLHLQMPISSDLTNPCNFITKIANCQKMVNISDNMTVLDEMLPLTIEMAKRNLTGVYNFTNPGTVSLNEILSMYKEYIDPSFQWANFTLEEQSKVVFIPHGNNELETSKLQKEFPRLLPIKESLLEYVFERNAKTLALINRV